MKLNTKRDIESITECPSNFAKNNFITNYLPQINDKDNRYKYYVDYEFPNKQGYLLDFWSMAIEKTFRILIQGFSIQMGDLKEIYYIDRISPICLDKIVSEIILKNKYFLIHNLDSDLNTLISKVESPGSFEFVNKIKNIFSLKSNKKSDDNLSEILKMDDKIRKDSKNSKNDKEVIDNHSYLISITNFISNYNTVKNRYTELFCDKVAVLEEDIFYNFENIFNLNQSDYIILLKILLIKKYLYRGKFVFNNKPKIYYSLLKPGDKKLDKALVLLKIKFETQLMEEGLTRLIEKKTVIENNLKDTISKIKIARNTNEKEHLEKRAKTLISQKNLFFKKINELEQKILFLSNTELKLSSENDTNTLKEINKVLEYNIESNESYLNLLNSAFDNLDEAEGINSEIDNMYNTMMNNNEYNIDEELLELNNNDTNNNPKPNPTITKKVSPPNYESVDDNINKILNCN